jgi:hypothetical protein
MMITGGLADLTIIETNLGLFLKTVFDFKTVRYLRIIFCTLLIAPTSTYNNFTRFHFISLLGSLFLFIYYLILMGNNKIIKYHILSYIIIHYHTLSYIIIHYHILSYIYYYILTLKYINYIVIL